MKYSLVILLSLYWRDQGEGMLPGWH